MCSVFPTSSPPFRSKVVSNSPAWPAALLPPTSAGSVVCRLRSGSVQEVPTAQPAPSPQLTVQQEHMELLRWCEGCAQQCSQGNRLLWGSGPGPVPARAASGCTKRVTEGRGRALAPQDCGLAGGERGQQRVVVWGNAGARRIGGARKKLWSKCVLTLSAWSALKKGGAQTEAAA